VKSRIVLALLLCGLVAGCSSHRAADKLGGPAGPTVLRLAASDPEAVAESAQARYFAAQVRQLSSGRLRIAVTFDAGGTGAPDGERRTIELVRSGRYDLGWVPTRAWDELGLTSFEALQAPFLITSYPLLGKVLRSVGPEMLAGLGDRRLVGLGLIPGLLRHPVGIAHPLVALADFDGARVRDFPSRASDALLRALGAVPAHVSNADLGLELARSRIDGEEMSLANSPFPAPVTANVTLFPKVLTLFVSKQAFSRLGKDDQEVLRAAAGRTFAHVSTFTLKEGLAFESVLARGYCAVTGRILLATARERAALVRAAAPVYTHLRRDAKTSEWISRIRALKASTPDAAPITVPASCLGLGTTASAAGRGPVRPPNILNGTYHRVLTGHGNAHPLVITEVLRDGKWVMNASRPADRGTYSIQGHVLTIRLAKHAMRFRFRRDPNGTLHLSPILPMESGDRWIMAGAPWIRVGPPTSRFD
jgi:TRAP-type C4-dicarboxylate transport system substrate-binding protein